MHRSYRFACRKVWTLLDYIKARTMYGVQWLVAVGIVVYTLIVTLGLRALERLAGWEQPNMDQPHASSALSRYVNRLTEDESWQGAFTDAERRVCLHFGIEMLILANERGDLEETYRRVRAMLTTEVVTSVDAGQSMKAGETAQE